MFIFFTQVSVLLQRKLRSLLVALQQAPSSEASPSSGASPKLACLAALQQAPSSEASPSSGALCLPSNS